MFKAAPIYLSLQAQTFRGAVWRGQAFELLAHSMVGVLREAHSAIYPMRLRLMAYTDPRSGLQAYRVPMGVDRRSGLIRCHDVVVRVVDRLDDLAYLRHVAEMELFRRRVRASSLLLITFNYF